MCMIFVFYNIKNIKIIKESICFVIIFILLALNLPIFWKPKMLVCTLREEGGGGLKKCTVCTLMKMLTFLDGPLIKLPA